MRASFKVRDFLTKVFQFGGQMGNGILDAVDVGFRSGGVSHLNESTKMTRWRQKDKRNIRKEDIRTKVRENY